MAGPLSSLGNVFLNLGERVANNTERRRLEDRQDKLTQEQRAYEGQRTNEARQYQTQTQIETEKRALINSLVSSGLLAPADVENPAAVTAAFQKATPEWQRDFHEKQQIKDDLNKMVAAGIVQDYDTETDDLGALRSMVTAARAAAGGEHMKDVSLERKYKESAIAENDAQAAGRSTAVQMQTNREWWAQQADLAASDYEATALTPAETQQAQALAAAAAGPQANEVIFNQALEKATKEVLDTKKRGALLRYQNAQRAMQYGTGIPKAGGPGASTVPSVQDGTKTMQDFMGTPSGARTSAAAVPAGSGASTLMTTAATLPIEKIVSKLPIAGASTVARFLPPLRAAYLGYEAGDALNNYFPNNPLARVGRAAGRDFAEATGIGPSPQDFRRPLASSIADPYGR